MTPLLFPLAEHEDGLIRGEAWWVDHFGNVQTNVSPDDLAVAGIGVGDQVSVVVGGVPYEVPWHSAFGDVESGSRLAYVDSYGLIALAVRDGRADEAFNVNEGMAVVLKPAT